MIKLLNKYKVFVAVSEHLNITKTSEAIHLSQPAISQAINSIEKEWGFPIFHRVKSGVELTTNGEYLLSFVNKVLVENERLMQEIQFIKGLKKGTVRVGTFPSVTTKWIANIIKKMNTEYPGIKITIVEENYETIQKLILNGMLDCGFISNEPNYSSLSFIPLIKDYFYCLVNKCHSVTKKGKFPIKLVEKFPFIIPGKGGSVELNEFFKAHNIRPNTRYEIMDINQSIQSMIENDLGISILPNLLIGNIPENVVTMKLDVDFYRTIGLVYMNTPSPATKTFIDCTKSFLNIH